MNRDSSKMKNVIIIKKHTFGGDFLAINLFGCIFSLRDLTPTELNHELIHSAQQRELLYVPFFIWYGIEWILLFFKYRNWIKAYYHIRFEQEAYKHQCDLSYLKKRKKWHYSY